MSNSLRGAAILAHGGAPTQVINATLAGIVAEASSHPEITAVYGARNGIRGVVGEDFYDLSGQDASTIEKIGRTPSSALGSSREHLSDEDYERVFRIFQAHEIRYFFYNGGNGSMHTAKRMQELAADKDYELRVLGLPKTIDNDLPETDHCPGYGSAARFIASAVRDIGADNRALPGPIEVVEVMGRDAGWLVAATALARHDADDAPHLIYCPERKLPREQLLADVEAVYKRLGRVVITVCEGQRDENGNPFGADLADAHSFGYRMTSNLGHAVAEFIHQKLDLRTRSCKPRVLGRSSAAFISETDRQEAQECGRAAVRAAVAGETGRMVTLVRASTQPYQWTTRLAPLEKVAGLTKLFPADWIHPAGNDVSDEFLDYLKPLTGEIQPLAQLQELFVEKRVR